MHIFLETDDWALVAAIANLLPGKFNNTSISKGIREAELSQPVGQLDNMAYIYYGSDIFGHLSVGQARLAQYAFASEGAVLFTDKPRKEFPRPIYAGNLATGNSDRLLVHLDYAKRRADEIKALPVNYFGVTLEDPKNVLVIDNKSWEKFNLPLIQSVLDNAPDNWWHSVAFVSTANTEYLRDFFEDTMSYSTAVALTKAAVAKLNQVGVEYTDASDFTPTKRGGNILRELTRRANDTQLT